MRPFLVKILCVFAFGLPAGGIYLAVKYFTGDMTDRVWWTALTTALVVGIGGAISFDTKPSETRAEK